MLEKEGEYKASYNSDFAETLMKLTLEEKLERVEKIKAQSNEFLKTIQKNFLAKKEVLEQTKENLHEADINLLNAQNALKDAMTLEQEKQKALKNKMNEKAALLAEQNTMVSEKEGVLGIIDSNRKLEENYLNDIEIERKQVSNQISALQKKVNQTYIKIKETERKFNWNYRKVFYDVSSAVKDAKDRVVDTQNVLESLNDIQFALRALEEGAYTKQDISTLLKALFIGQRYKLDLNHATVLTVDEEGVTTKFKYKIVKGVLILTKIVDDTVVTTIDEVKNAVDKGYIVEAVREKKVLGIKVNETESISNENVDLLGFDMNIPYFKDSRRNKDRYSYILVEAHEEIAYSSDSLKKNIEQAKANYAKAKQLRNSAQYSYDVASQDYQRAKDELDDTLNEFNKSIKTTEAEIASLQEQVSKIDNKVSESNIDSIIKNAINGQYNLSSNKYIHYIDDIVEGTISYSDLDFGVEQGKISIDDASVIRNLTKAIMSLNHEDINTFIKIYDLIQVIQGTHFEKDTIESCLHSIQSFCLAEKTKLVIMETIKEHFEGLYDGTHSNQEKMLDKLNLDIERIEKESEVAKEALIKAKMDCKEAEYKKEMSSNELAVFKANFFDYQEAFVNAKSVNYTLEEVYEKYINLVNQGNEDNTEIENELELAFSNVEKTRLTCEEIEKNLEVKKNDIDLARKKDIKSIQ